MIAYVVVWYLLSRSVEYDRRGQVYFPIHQWRTIVRSLQARRWRWYWKPHRFLCMLPERWTTRFLYSKQWFVLGNLNNLANDGTHCSCAVYKILEVIVCDRMRATSAAMRAVCHRKSTGQLHDWCPSFIGGLVFWLQSLIHGGRRTRLQRWMSRVCAATPVTFLRFIFSCRYSLRHRGTWNGLCDIAGINCDQ